MLRSPILLLLIAVLRLPAARGELQTTSGEIVTPHPTLENLAVEWLIEGDDNLNGVVSTVEIHGMERIELEETFEAVTFPNPPVSEKEVPDLRLKPGSRAIDAGQPIPNINDDFNKKAPDCGAYEFGQKLPHYGPRSR